MCLHTPTFAIPLATTERRACFCCADKISRLVNEYETGFENKRMHSEEVRLDRSALRCLGVVHCLRSGTVFLACVGTFNVTIYTVFILNY